MSLTHTSPWLPWRSLRSYLLCSRTHPYHVTLLPTGSVNFWAKPFLPMNTPTFLKRSHSTPIRLWRWNRHSVPKRRHIKFRRRGVTQKEAYNIQNTAKVCMLLFNSVSYIFLLLCLCIIVMYVLFCIFCFHRANWHSPATLTEVFFHAFSSVVRQMPG